jgi:hypothetical protein
VIDLAARATLAALADILVPAAEGMPAASEAGVAERWIDQVLEARPDLVEPLQRILAAARSAEGAPFLEALEANDPAAFNELAVAVVGAYYLNPDIHRLLGYTGQQAKQVDVFELPAYIEEGLLDEVVERGPIYRPTP